VDILFLKVFSYAICLEFLVLAHSIPGMIVFERGTKSNVMVVECTEEVTCLYH